MTALRTRVRTTGKSESSLQRGTKHIANIKVVAHPSELLLSKSDTTLFVFISIASQLQVIDANKRQVVSTWKVSSDRPGDAAFDESTSRLTLD